VEDKDNNDHSNQINKTLKKIEVCYLCHEEFDINLDDESHYHYGEFPMCAYCSEFYGFYNKDKK